MECPYCKIEMLDGILVGDRYANTWEGKDSSISP